MSIRPLPAGCIFADKGPAAFTGNDIAFLGLMQSLPFAGLASLHLAAADAAARSYEVGLIQRMPVPQTVAGTETASHEAIDAKRTQGVVDEINHLFISPAVCMESGDSLNDRARNQQVRRHAAQEKLAACRRHLDEVCFSLYGIEGRDRAAMGDSVAQAGVVGSDVQSDDAEAFSDGALYTPLQGVQELLSYALGCIVGRWDVRWATELPTPKLPDPFDPLPVSSPGMLQTDGGMPSMGEAGGYPLHISLDGIVVDDPDHPNDVVRRVQKVLEVIWGDRAEVMEKEAAGILGIEGLRDYFRKAGKGRFWEDHVSRYSKSRRKAPIYWMLQSAKKSYGLWLYYHRLDKDILFKARQNYVDPKIRLEQTRLDSLRSQKSVLGTDAKGAKKFDKDIERQESLLGELEDFADKLDRAAKLKFGKQEGLDSDVKYDPDLNDGVVLNIAPLWELVPWKEARTYWEELLDGKYEWSSMGKLLRKKGLVKQPPP